MLNNVMHVFKQRQVNCVHLTMGKMSQYFFKSRGMFIASESSFSKF